MSDTQDQPQPQQKHAEDEQFSIAIVPEATAIEEEPVPESSNNGPTSATAESSVSTAKQSRLSMAFNKISCGKSVLPNTAPMSSSVFFAGVSPLDALCSVHLRCCACSYRDGQFVRHPHPLLGEWHRSGHSLEKPMSVSPPSPLTSLFSSPTIRIHFAGYTPFPAIRQ